MEPRPKHTELDEVGVALLKKVWLFLELQASQRGDEEFGKPLRKEIYDYLGASTLQR